MGFETNGICAMSIRSPVKFKLFLGLAIAIGSTVIGYIGATESYGFGQPIILVFVLVSLIVGAVFEKIIDGMVLEVISGVMGAIGIMLRLVSFSNFSELIITLEVLGASAAICCVITGFLGRLLNRGGRMFRTYPSRNQLAPNRDAKGLSQ
jgi:hypothetical protein